ncbi:UNVERIFIED_CONTAM: LINE-1 reverse transcriptase [Sesamum indicum]
MDSSTVDDGVCGTDTLADVGDETADDGGPASGGQNFGNGAGKEKLLGFHEEKKMRTLVSPTTSSLPMDGNPISLEGMTTELVDFVHRTFTRWIEECVSTTSFSIGLNGKPHRFFTGARGLRQGDPLFPYLFVLVMEVLHLGFLQRIEQDMQFTYHWKCENSKIFQLGFAEDLLLFCRADGDSIRVFKEGLDRFAELSGLRLNVHKSHLIISRSAQELKDQMLDILGFQEGHLLMSEHGGSWGWQKMLRLRPFLRSIMDYQIGNRERFYIWQDPWHHLGPLIERFPRAPHHLGIEKSAKLSSVISAGERQWPPITDFECLEITHNLPIISGGEDRVVWRCDGGLPTTQALYRVFDPPEPKVGWASLLSGSLKIPRHSFILWLAILGKLPTTDKPWLSHFGDCILCKEGEIETHSHLFFQCRFSRQCLTAIRRKVRFHWPNRDWANDIEWASRRWRGKHIVNIAYQALLAFSVYHIWRERNLRRFEHIERTPSTMALLIVDDVRQRIISISLASSVSTRALYRLWRIPWPVKGETT